MGQATYSEIVEEQLQTEPVETEKSTDKTDRGE